MGKLISINQAALGDVVQSRGRPEKDPRNGFKLGGWVVPHWDEQKGERLDHTVSGAYDLLLRRRTHEMFAAHWHYGGKNPITDGFNRATKYVATRGKPKFERVNSQVLWSDVPEAVVPKSRSMGSSSFLQGIDRGRPDRRLSDPDLSRGPWPRQTPVRRGHPAIALRFVETEQASTGVIFPAAICGMVQSSPDRWGHASKAELACRRRRRKHEFDERW
jgi:hypothetical protein